MVFLLINEWLPEKVIKALCWTFIHSLWQGLIIAIIAGLLLMATKKSKANLRYNLLALLFAFFLAVAGLTLLMELSYFISQSVNEDKLVLISFTKDIAYANQVNKFFQMALTAFLNKYAGFLVLLWFIFFITKCIKIFSRLYHIQLLTRSQFTFPLNEWVGKVEELSKTLGIKFHVDIYESCLVKGPLTIGFLKPAIIVPLSILSNLPPEQVESVLLHELAHIRREDYLINLLQSFAETIFFFNPAVLWISGLIRQEREVCCDDIVLIHHPERKTYLQALVFFQEYASSSANLAMRFTMKQSLLVDRVNRIVTKENRSLNIFEKSIFILGVMAMIAFGLIIGDTKAITTSRFQALSADSILSERSKRPNDEVKANTQVFNKYDRRNQRIYIYNTAISSNKTQIKIYKNMIGCNSESKKEELKNANILLISGIYNGMIKRNKINGLPSQLKGILVQMKKIELLAKWAKNSGVLNEQSQQEAFLKMQEELKKEQERKFSE